MAPKKRKGEGDVEQVKTETTSVRVTRSSTRRANTNSTEFPQPELPRKKAKTKAKAKAKAKVEPETENGEENTGDDDSNKTTVVIEHCKQCNSFKTRAIQVKNGLENGVPGVTVLLNPDKPRRGCFEIRVEGGEKFISLLDMKRPFTLMKALDMDKVISDIIDKMK